MIQRGPTALRFTLNWLEAWVISEGSKCITQNVDPPESSDALKKHMHFTVWAAVSMSRGNNPTPLTDYNLVLLRVA